MEPRDVIVKICGITSPAALDAAVEAGADAIGFVFAASPREVAPETAREWCRALPADIVRVAVMRHPSRERVARVLGELAPDWLQTDAEDFAGLVLPDGCRPLPVYRSGSVPADLGARLGGSGSVASPESRGAARPPQLLYEGPVSGSGRTADWDEARTLAARVPLMLAGGLDADNVADAIRGVRPCGVDVSSGVESARGVKDPGRIREFVARARAAAAAGATEERR